MLDGSRLMAQGSQGSHRKTSNFGQFPEPPGKMEIDNYLLQNPRKLHETI
jgi:hypothetical protein